MQKEEMLANRLNRHLRTLGLAIRDAGGATIDQDEATSTLLGMPRAAFE